MDQSLFPAPHGLTQGITSFIASCCQGIHQTPFSRLIRPRKSTAPSGRYAVRLPLRRERRNLVSVLDLDNAARRPNGNAFTLEGASDADVSLFTMSNRPIGRHDARRRPAVKSEWERNEGNARRDRAGDGGSRRT